MICYLTLCFVCIHCKSDSVFFHCCLWCMRLPVVVSQFRFVGVWGMLSVLVFSLMLNGLFAVSFLPTSAFMVVGVAQCDDDIGDSNGPDVVVVDLGVCGGVGTCIWRNTDQSRQLHKKTKLLCTTTKATESSVGSTSANTTTHTKLSKYLLPVGNSSTIAITHANNF